MTDCIADAPEFPPGVARQRLMFKLRLSRAGRLLRRQALFHLGDGSTDGRGGTLH